MSTAKGSLAADYRLLADAIERCSLEEMELYLQRTQWTGDELPAIEEAIAHLQMLWSLHITRVLTGCSVRKLSTVWLVEPLPQGD